MNFKKLYLIIALSFLSCKKDISNSAEITSKITDSIPKVLENKFEFIDTKWIEIEKINNSQKKPDIKDEWLAFVEVNKEDATIYLMEPVKYNLDSIQSTKNGIILHIKNSDWVYSFSWIDEKKTNRKMGLYL